MRAITIAELVGHWAWAWGIRLITLTLTLLGQQLQVVSISYFTPGSGLGHFVSRFLDCQHMVWFHDGIETGRWCRLEGQDVSLKFIQHGA